MDKFSRFISALLIFTFFLILFTSAAYASTPTFGPNILVTDAGSPFSSSGDGPPILDLDIAGGVYVAWIDHRGSQPGAGQTEVFFSKLTPDGSAFSSNKPLTGINNTKTFPQIEESEGNIYIAWNETRIGAPIQDGVFFSKSTDGGQTFTEENFIDTSDKLPISMVATAGKIYIVYSKSAQEIWLASSQDGGNTFNKKKISDSSTGGRQRPVVDFSGNNIHAFWLDSRNGKYEIFYSRSDDGGNSFNANQSVFSHPDSGIHLLGNSFGRLSTRVVGQKIFLAFDFYLQTSSPFSTDYEVYLIKTTDGGANFTEAQRLSGDPVNSKTRQQGPSLTLLPDGSPAIAWHDFRDGDGKVMLAYSQDQGSTFSANVRINNTPTNNVFSSPTIVADNEGKIHFVRWDAALSPSGVYYTKIELGLQFEVAPSPFLDLPWDYQSKGLSFNDAALAINSYFDHEYPLLSSGLSEPAETRGNLTNFEGKFRELLEYSLHDGYDYGSPAKINLGDPVLTAAGGCASYQYSGAGGNTIKIDHGNGYQTRYLHLLDDARLITKSPACTNVSKGQAVGSVGYSGNVRPPGEKGAHIHFMVIQDKNNDGNFDDNIPDGVTDPFGWQSAQPDPWPNYSFNYAGQDRTGNKSFYLWTKPIAKLSSLLTSNGGFFELERYKLEFPQGATNQDLQVEMHSAPIAKPSSVLQSIGSTIIASAKNASGQFIEEFTKPYTIRIDFGSFDLSAMNLATISIYSSQDAVSWVKEPTSVDLENKKATAEISHFSHFALMAERIDTQAPTTTAILSGEQGQQNWFRSNVQLSLNAQDNPEGLGVDYTLYKVDDEDWQQYAGPVNFSGEGAYTVEFYSVDKDENIEERKKVTFNVDKTPPEAKVFIDQNKQDLVVAGQDQNQTVVERTENSETKKKNDAIYKVTDLAGNILRLDVRDRDKEKQDRFRIFSIRYNNDTVITQPNNYFSVIYQGRKHRLNVLEQNFKIKNEVKIRIRYNRKKDQSTIIIRQNGQEKVKEIKPGLILLQLITNKGKLEYSY